MTIFYLPSPRPFYPFIPDFINVWFLIIFFLRSSCFGIGFVFPSLADAASDDSVGKWKMMTTEMNFQQVQGFPLTNLRHIAILCTFFFVLSFLSSEIFLLTTTSKSESFNFFSFFLFCRLFQLHMFPAFFLMSLSVNFNQFLKQFQSCNFCHF